MVLVGIFTHAGIGTGLETALSLSGYMMEMFMVGVDRRREVIRLEEVEATGPVTSPRPNVPQEGDDQLAGMLARRCGPVCVTA